MRPTYDQVSGQVADDLGKIVQVASAIVGSFTIKSSKAVAGRSLDIFIIPVAAMKVRLSHTSL